ncbi:MAG: DmsE family decaheme c-type cytochrome [bacterium]|nr:DmsE family decaheme c-type cytochrome [bacterium]
MSSSSLNKIMTLLSCLILLGCSQVLALDNFASGFDLPEDATYVGSETCLDCHEEVGDLYAHTPHSVELAPMVPGGQADACEACHGPGSIHSEEEDIDTIINVDMMRAMDSSQKDAMCLQCHTENHVGWAGGPHQGSEISCSDCHADLVHFEVQAKPAADFRNESEFCIQCHTSEVGDFRMPFRHRVLEDQISCNDCHDPHNGFPTDTWNGINDTCLKCHTEMAGPFVFEHDGVQSEDCTVCHKPHGSTHDKMLVTDGNTLCLQCHYESEFNSDENWTLARVPHGGMLGTEGRCYDCHNEIHGSNVAPSFRDQ